MALTAKDKGGIDLPPCPSGMHHAICYGVVDIGTQPAFGKFPSRRKVVILFEFPELRIQLPDKKDPSKKLDLPRALSIKETLTLASKGNLRPILEGWRGRVFTPKELEGFDLKNVIGANALVNVIQEAKDGKTYANISTINPLPTGMQRRKGELPTTFFSFEEVAVGKAINLPEGLPQWVTGLIMQSDEYITRSQQVGQPPRASEGESRQADAPDEEDVPF